MPLRSARGFTLIEVLIAVTVFAVLAAAVYVSLNALADAAFTQRQRSAELADLQRSLARLDADLRQVATRPVRGADGQLLPALAGRRDRVEATRTGWLNPMQQQRSELQRFGWSADGTSLVRSSWAVTDLTPASARLDERLPVQIAELEFAFLDPAGQWLESWPPDESLYSLPGAVRYRFESARLGRIERVIVLP